MRTPLLALGACSPIGLNARQIALAFRAGIGAPETAGDSAIDGAPLGAWISSGIARDIVGKERLYVLGCRALREALAVMPPRSAPEALFLGLPSPRPGFPEEALVDVVEEHAEEASLAPSAIEIVVSDHVALAGALARARRYLATRPDACVLVGAVDSYHHPETYAWLDESHRMLTDRSERGFIPSEAATFFVLGGANVEPRGAGTITFAEELREPSDVHDQALGTTLVASAAEHASRSPIPWIFTDQNNERFRTKVWSYVAARLRDVVAPGKTKEVKLGTLVGDTGAASLGVALVIASNGLELGFAPGPSALLFGMTEQGERGVIVIDADTA